MPWKECSAVSERQEFVRLMEAGTLGIAEMCRRFGISRKTGYKWLLRFEKDGPAGLSNRSRRPIHSPRRTSSELEQAVLCVRAAHPVWGGRKIRQVLLDDGYHDVPAASTISGILRRHGLIDPEESRKHTAWVRFERARPNDLWQMDFKGHFAMDSGRCHPLTVLDDHSRYCVGLRACENERGNTVRTCLTRLFRRYGLPRQMLMDNGAPWGSDAFHPWTPLSVWLLQLGIGVSHGRPYHPQTQGKDERFHRTLNAELIRGNRFEDLVDCQTRFDDWRTIYNERRPHEALEMSPPAKRFAASPRLYPEQLPEIEYGPGIEVRCVGDGGRMLFRSRHYRVGAAFRGHRVGLRPTEEDGVFEVYFGVHKIAWINERTGRWGRPRAATEDKQDPQPIASSAGQASVRYAHSGPAGRRVPPRSEDT